MPRTAVVWIVLAAAIMVAAPLSAAGPTATVHGVEAVNVRRGPSPDSPAFTMLRRGAQVRVEATAGAWALVQLAGGERGYIHAAYLALPPGARVPTIAGEPTAATPVAHDGTPTGAPPQIAAAPSEAAAPVDTPDAAQMEHRLEQALERIRALESARTDPSIAPAAHTPKQGADTPPPLGLEAPTPSDEFGDFRDIAPSLALAGVGFAIGFLLGMAYGQRQERHRRGRVRF